MHTHVHIIIHILCIYIYLAIHIYDFMMVLQCTVDWGPVFVCHDKPISTLASQMLMNYYWTGPANQLRITSINLYTKICREI